MSIFSKLFGKKDNTSAQSAEDFMSLVRVYFQSVLAVNLGLPNIRANPDVALFKRLFKIPTTGGKLGQGEKTASKKMLIQDYGLSENFFKEIDNSIKKHVRNQNQVQSYMYMYQGFTADLMMMISNLMQWKMRVPSIFSSVLKNAVEDTVHDICTKPVFKKDDEQKTAMQIRTYKERLDYSEQWMSEFVYKVVMLAKKEKRSKNDEQVESK